MNRDSDIFSDTEMMDSFPDMPEYRAPQVYSCRSLDPSILELEAEQAVALGLPAVPLQRLPYDDDFGSSRWVEKKDFENAHHYDLVRLPAIVDSFNSEKDGEIETIIDETQQLVVETRQDSVVEGSQKRQYIEIVDEPEEHDANSDNPNIDPVKRTKRPRFATPTSTTSFHSQNVSFKSKAGKSQQDPMIIDSESDEDDTPQPSSTDLINVDSESEDGKDDTSQSSSARPISVDSDSESSEDDSSQPGPTPPTTNSTLTAASSSSTTTTSSSRAPPGTWTPELRTLINEVKRPDGHFDGTSIECAQVIKAVYPNFALAHLSDLELAKRVNAQWKERDYPNRPDWVRIRAMRVQDEGLRAGIRGRIRGTGILR